MMYLQLIDLDDTGLINFHGFCQLFSVMSRSTLQDRLRLLYSLHIDHNRLRRHLKLSNNSLSSFPPFSPSPSGSSTANTEQSQQNELGITPVSSFKVKATNTAPISPTKSLSPTNFDSSSTNNNDDETDYTVLKPDGLTDNPPVHSKAHNLTSKEQNTTDASSQTTSYLDKMFERNLQEPRALEQSFQPPDINQVC